MAAFLSVTHVHVLFYISGTFELFDKNRKNNDLMSSIMLPNTREFVKIFIVLGLNKQSKYTSPVKFYLKTNWLLVKWLTNLYTYSKPCNIPMRDVCHLDIPTRLIMCGLMFEMTNKWHIKSRDMLKALQSFNVGHNTWYSDRVTLVLVCWKLYS